MTSGVKNKIKEYKTALWVTPSGLTWRLQSLDFSINNVLKESLRNKYVGYWTEKNKSIKKCNQWMDWWIMVFRFCYSQWNDI